MASRNTDRPLVVNRIPTKISRQDAEMEKFTTTYSTEARRLLMYITYIIRTQHDLTWSFTVDNGVAVDDQVSSFATIHPMDMYLYHLSSAVSVVALAGASESHEFISDNELQNMRRTIREFILNPLDEIREKQRKEGNSSEFWENDKWEQMNTAYGFDVQACYILHLFASVSDSMYDPRRKPLVGRVRHYHNDHEFLAQRIYHDRLLVACLPNLEVFRMGICEQLDELMMAEFEHITAESLRTVSPRHFPMHFAKHFLRNDSKAPMPEENVGEEHGLKSAIKKSHEKAMSTHSSSGSNSSRERWSKRLRTALGYQRVRQTVH